MDTPNDQNQYIIFFLLLKKELARKSAECSYITIQIIFF